MNTFSPSQILEDEIVRLMADRRCGREEATAICRQLMKNLANAADLETAGLVTLTNISPQRNNKNMASKSNSPNPPPFTASPKWDGPQRDSVRVNKSDVATGRASSASDVRVAPPAAIDVRPDWHYNLPFWPVPILKLAEMGFPTNPEEDDWALLRSAFSRAKIDPSLLAGLLTRIISARTNGHAMTLNDALEYVKVRTKAVANSASAQFRGLVNTAVNQQSLSYGEAWTLTGKAHPDLVALMNAKCELRSDEGLALANEARKSAGEEFTDLVNQKVKATGYSFAEAWQACRTQHSEIYARMGN